MDSDIADELLNELFSAFETIDTQSGAILQFLKDKGMATDEQLAPYIEQAGNASNVRWRAARIRINSLLSSAANKTEETLVRKAEEAAQKAIAAERESEKSTRRRGKDIGEKQPRDQAYESGEQQVANTPETEQLPEPDDKRQTTETSQVRKIEGDRGKRDGEGGDGEKAHSEEQHQNHGERDSGENDTRKKIA